MPTAYAAIPTWLLVAGLAKETTWGTPVAATTFYRVKSPKYSVKYASTIEDGMSASAAKDQAWYQATGATDFDLGELLFYPDDTVHPLMGLLGTDTVTGTGPYTHTLTLNNSAFPPSYTLARYSGLQANADQFPGCLFSEATLKFSNPGKFTFNAKGMGMLPTPAGGVTKPTAAFSAAPILMPWQGAFTIGGSSNLRAIDFEVQIKRPVEMIFPMSGQQGPGAYNVSVMEVTGKLTFTSVDMTEVNYYLNNTQPVVSAVFTSGTNSLTLQMSKCAFESPTEIDHGQPYARTTASFRAIANSADAGTGNAPIKITVANGRSTTY